MIKRVITGNEAVAYAMKQIDPEVVAAYPITPQTQIIEKYAEYYAKGEVSGELIDVESEHSAMSAVVGAAGAGVRAMTATSSQGLALMLEIVYIAAAMRLPILMPVVNRALSGPINIHCDHSDTMMAANSGWLQFYSENNQDVYDINAYRKDGMATFKYPPLFALITTLFALTSFTTSVPFSPIFILVKSSLDESS